jgi:hypothetical protein
MFLGNKVRPVCGADNLTAYCLDTGILNISQPYRRPRPVMRIALLLTLLYFTLCMVREPLCFLTDPGLQHSVTMEVGDTEKIAKIMEVADPWSDCT